MINAGSMGMPLHFGKMPRWLTERMGNMGILIVESMIQNYGKNEVVKRFSDPNWFQAMGAVMGMQWNSSGVTATVLGSLRRKINPRSHELGLYILGGKGRYYQYIPQQIRKVSYSESLDSTALIKANHLTGRIDNNAIIDGYSLYQKYFILSSDAQWTSISQGMDTNTRRARRYHWYSEECNSFVNDPHTAIVGKKKQNIINLADSRAEKARNNLVEIISNKPSKINNEIKKINLPDHHDVRESDLSMKRLGAVLEMAYNRQIDNFEDLVSLRGVGPKTLRSLALVSEVIHGDKSRFEDPSRFSFAVGGKDGRPFPVDTKAYDETIDILQDSVEGSKLGYKEKSVALKRLHRATKGIESIFTPAAFLKDIIDMEWGAAEKNGGMTFMGKVKKGVTRKIVSLQNRALYGKK